MTAPRGFLAAGIAAGIKRAGLDLAVVCSTRPAAGAALFTRNQVQAAPVLVSRKHLRDSRGAVRAVLLNSGCANACTGRRGIRDAVESCRSLAPLLNAGTEEIVVASTGVIGAFLPLEKIRSGVKVAVRSLSSQGGEEAMRAIMTTDTREKNCAVTGRLDGKLVRIGGMAKGAGMIHPDMATMLAVLTTDVSASPSVLRRIMRRVVERTFNCLTVDGDTSTNDMVLIMANGASGSVLSSRQVPEFEAGLEKVCRELARMIARDGEGASKFVEICVDGASSFEAARRVAKSIAHSPLVKTALYGQELNWGRILCAAGYSGVAFDPEAVTLHLNGIPVYRSGGPVLSHRRRAEKQLRKRDLQIRLALHVGRHSARVWTCDLTHEYVNINASYIS